MNHISAIANWQSSRNLDKMPYKHTNEIKNIIEECVEASGLLTSTQAREVSTNIVDTYILETYTPNAAVDAYCDIIVYAVGAIMKLGYYPEIALDECIKEISDRTGSYDPAAGKLVKLPPKPAAYKADYSKALI